MTQSRWRRGPWWLAVALALAACDDPLENEAEHVRTGALELIGINGRRLGEGDDYRVPLDSARTIEVGRLRREALVLINRNPREVVIETMTLAAAGEWRLLQPTRARDADLIVREQRLAPGAHLDFDVAITPLEAGPRVTWLELRWRVGQRTESRQVRFIATASEEAGPDPPVGPQGSSR